MRRLLFTPLLVLVACGGVVASAPSVTARGAMMESPEALELEPVSVRQELFADVSRMSLKEAGAQASQLVLFPIVQDGQALAAPGFDARTDLLQPSDDAQDRAALVVDGSGDRWPSDRRDGLQGLSEREAAELVARSLISVWNLHPHGQVTVERATGAPYAAAWVDGILRINPSFLYLACAGGPPGNEAVSKR